MVENCLPTIFALPILFYIYPLPTFVTFVIYCLARLQHQQGYATKGYGGHVPGFMFDKLTTNIFLGLLIVTYVKMVL